VEWLKVKALSSNSSTGVGGTLKYSKITACPSKVIMRHYRTDSWRSHSFSRTAVLRMQYTDPKGWWVSKVKIIVL
jgi:hypothetical protein